jgi:hypothetical protein
MDAIEIVHDPIEEAVESGLLMDKRHEVLPDGEWIRAARKWTGRENLFVYHHALTGGFVLAEWIYKDPRVCVELEVMGAPPDRGGWFDQQFMLARCQPLKAQIAGIKKTMQTASAQKEAARLEQAGKKKEVVEHYRRRGMPEVAASVGASPYQSEGEAYEKTCERLNRMVKLA